MPSTLSQWADFIYLINIYFGENILLFCWYFTDMSSISPIQRYPYISHISFYCKHLHTCSFDVLTYIIRSWTRFPQPRYFPFDVLPKGWWRPGKPTSLGHENLKDCVAYDITNGLFDYKCNMAPFTLCEGDFFDILILLFCLEQVKDEY